jgi:hypothetical protein
MELKNIDQIGEKLVVFMPSGIQATLTKNEDKVFVEYPEMHKDEYTHEAFKELIEEGIFIFNEPSIVMESVEDELDEEKIVETIDELTTLMQKIEECAKDSILTRKHILHKEEKLNEGVMNKLKGFIRESLVEAYSQEDCEPGSVYTVIKDKEKEHVTAEDKNNMLDNLNKIAKNFPDVKVRQQALTFVDELGLQEYCDLEAVRKFIDKNLEKLAQQNTIEESYCVTENTERSLNEINTQINYYGVQYRNMHTGIHQLLYTDTKENAQQILSYLNQMEKLDTDIYSEEELEHQINFLWEEINKLDLGGFEINYRDVKEDGMYDDIFIINYADPKPDIYESLNEKEDIVYELQHKKTGKTIWSHTKTMPNYKFTGKTAKNTASWCATGDVPTAIKEEYGPFKGNIELELVADELQTHAKSGKLPKLGSWVCETSLDQKWETLSTGAKHYILENISWPVKDGHIYYDDLELVVTKDSLPKEDILSLDLSSNSIEATTEAQIY